MKIYGFIAKDEKVFCFATTSKMRYTGLLKSAEESTTVLWAFEYEGAANEFETKANEMSNKILGVDLQEIKTWF